MEFDLKSGPAEKLSTDCLILPVFTKNTLTTAGQQIDKASKGYIVKQLQRAHHAGERGRILLLPEVPGIAAERVLLLGCGDADGVSDLRFTELMAKLAKTLQEQGIKTALNYVTDNIAKARDRRWHLQTTIRVFMAIFYRFDQCKSEKDKDASKLTQVNFGFIEKLDKTIQKTMQAALEQGYAVGRAMNLVKDLGNLPPNICTPSYLGKEAERLAKTYPSIKTTVHDEAAIKRLKMGSFLAVAQGSEQPPRLITLEYHGGKKQAAPIVLVGKGITFDTGGYCLKPMAGMTDMKYDMLGAATVLAMLQAVAELQLPINVIGVIVSAENMISNKAYRVNDILTTMSGLTVEVLNTDAEGRLILCDALTYCERYKPEYVIDIATLTGAIIISLGLHTTGIFSNDDELAQRLTRAGNTCYDPAWQLPMAEEYHEQLKSPFADLANIGGPAAGSITAACFLSRFTKKYRWAHLDVAGTAMRSGGERCATGRPIPLLVEFLVHHATS